MQIKGFKLFNYDGQGSCSYFLSSLTHRSGYSDDGTYKVALFCEKKSSWKRDIKSNVKSYPNDLIIDSDNITNKEDEIQNKILISRSETTMFNGYLPKVENMMKNHEKSTAISGTGMIMVKNVKSKIWIKAH